MFTAPSVSGDMNSSGAGATSVPLALSNSSCAHPSGNLPNTATKSLIYICFFFLKDGVITCTVPRDGVTSGILRDALGGDLRLVEVEGERIVLHGRAT